MNSLHSINKYLFSFSCCSSHLAQRLLPQVADVPNISLVLILKLLGSRFTSAGAQKRLTWAQEPTSPSEITAVLFASVQKHWTHFYCSWSSNSCWPKHSGAFILKGYPPDRKWFSASRGTVWESQGNIWVWDFVSVSCNVFNPLHFMNVWQETFTQTCCRSTTLMSSLKVSVKPASSSSLQHRHHEHKTAVDLCF